MASNSAQLRYSHLLADWLRELGYSHCFFVAGGGCMHLIEGFRHQFQCTPVVHEVAAGIAAEHFNECTTSGKAFALVTTGPGLTNIVTAIAACFVEHREVPSEPVQVCGLAGAAPSRRGCPMPGAIVRRLSPV